MIEVTRLNGSIFFINPDLILTLEPTPDTVITLTTGEKYIVKEPPAEIIDRFVAFKRRIMRDGIVVKERQPIEE
jgi:flagellar protein FlbD